MIAELCRDVAFEAARRSPGVNPDELWAVLEEIEAAGAVQLVDLGSDAAVVQAWWSLGLRVVTVQAEAMWSGATRAPSTVVEIVGDTEDRTVRQRVVDQCAGREVDVLVIGYRGSPAGTLVDWQAYASLVRPGGIVLVHGIANRAHPGAVLFWSALKAPRMREIVGGIAPDGYGLVQVRERILSHG